jgi:hypothetical protein
MDERVLLLPSEVDLDVLRGPDSTSDADRSDSDLDSVQDDMEDNAHRPWLDGDCTPPDLPFTDAPLQDLLLEPAGVYIDEKNELHKYSKYNEELPMDMRRLYSPRSAVGAVARIGATEQPLTERKS